MTDVVDGFVGAYREVVMQLNEEPFHLMFVHMAESADEIILHGDNAERNVLDVGIRDVGMCLLGSKQLH